MRYIKVYSQYLKDYMTLTCSEHKAGFTIVCDDTLNQEAINYSNVFTFDEAVEDYISFLNVLGYAIDKEVKNESIVD